MKYYLKYLFICFPLFLNSCKEESFYIDKRNVREYSFVVEGELYKFRYCNIIPSFSSIFKSLYSFDKETFQGGAIADNTLFLTRHEGVIEVLEIEKNSFTFKNEFLVPFLRDTKAHLNTASFGNSFPLSESSFPYLYVDRCSYYSKAHEVSDSERNCCYVLSISENTATLEQTIYFMNDNQDYFASKFGGAQCWSVDKYRNLLLCIGYSMRGDERVYLIKEFRLPDVNSQIVELHDNDVIKQWMVSDKLNGIQHAFQAMSFTKDWIIIPVSRGDGGYESEAIRFFSKESNKELFCIELIENEVGEVQNVQEYKDGFFIISKNGRIDKLESIYETN